ncbi:ACP S-malonyltransferase [Streptomyces sp. NPDC051576]|uniref:ACP S-malonyltransferase n=1 Tax=Streptomyces sp. NPDC051576 TaxID=3155803 RepID=UPI0034248A5A
MGTTAFVFPGQGSQRVGMGQDLLAHWPELYDLYYGPADDILGIDLAGLCREGPIEALSHMPVTQPAVLLTSVAALHVLREHGVAPDVAAGHSLGEFAALVCAGVLDFPDALRLVRLRGELMARVNERVPGRMAAVVGLDLATMEALCDRAAAEAGEVVEIANHNDPLQVVVSGQLDGMDRLVRLVGEAGADRVVVLPITGPAHSSLMGGITEDFAAALAATEFRDPVVPVVSSTTARPVRNASDARHALREQLTGRVRWTETVAALTRAGVGRVVEVGPGRVLTGLCSRTAPGLETYRSNDASQLKRAAAACAYGTRPRPSETEVSQT